MRAKTVIPPRVLARVWKYVDHRQPWECWPWLASHGSHGYGQIGWTEGQYRTLVAAHRAIYTSIHGWIPDGMFIDHICRNHRCVNPAHLRPLTHSDNSRRNSWAAKTHCPAGHPYDEANTMRDRDGWRSCRQCGRDADTAKRRARGVLPSRKVSADDRAVIVGRWHSGETREDIASDYELHPDTVARFIREGRVRLSPADTAASATLTASPES